MDGTRAFDTGLDTELVAISLRCVGPLLGLAALLGTIALTAEVLERAGRARRTSALLGSITPRVFRRLAALAFVAIPVMQPVGDGDTPVRDWLASTTTSSTPLDAPPAGASLSDTNEPVTPPSEEPPPAVIEVPAPTTPTLADHYVVQPGDCLWTIAAHRLPVGATNLSIDAAWRRVYAANATAIGADPNLILVGLVLELPPLVST